MLFLFGGCSVVFLLHFYDTWPVYVKRWVFCPSVVFRLHFQDHLASFPEEVGVLCCSYLVDVLWCSCCIFRTPGQFT